MAPPWTTSKKTVSAIPTTNDRLSKSRTPITGYAPPSPPSTIDFVPSALFASMAKCAAIRRVAPAVSAALVTSSAALLGNLVDDAGSSFDLSSDFEAIADFERTGLTGRLGGGFADLCMAKMGYAWLDLSSELLPGLAGRLGDFIYDGPATGGHGVVLAEAKATNASSVTAGDVKGIADRGYRNQVDPHVGAVTVPGAGKIFHGYAVCLGAAPGVRGGLGHIVETAVATSPGGSGGTPAGGGSPVATTVGARLAIANYRAVFNLIDAPVLYGCLDRLLGSPGPFSEYESQEFLRFRYGDRWLLTGSDPTFCRWPRGELVPPLMLAEEIAEPLLEQISRILRTKARHWDGLPPFVLPSLPPIFCPDDAGPAGFRYVLAPDGLASPVDGYDEMTRRTWTVHGGLGS
ncbi:hypothetical protein [Methylobacterium brachythecii]|uniref:Uncharacterized protein n=1 Tax=Methylobacterium brachythecii TaxID=1176177 RepID=A0A7W6F8A6_9HYPH|nr:hypothetical protein [Methylobacterium brachythecii]MBB3903951.1 hypothetical protein [Methylobacterium brachythecii]GLS42697.1 hypothetical protein GCM10007884_06820 [Methylobacterium brachythecii]